VAVPAPHPWRTEGEGLDGVARRALLAFVSTPQALLDSGVGGAGVDEGQARVNRFVVIAPCMPPPPSAKELEKCKKTARTVKDESKTTVRLGAYV
jgi:hypothetical protein